ncbi:MAG: hypothetical protein RIR70_1721 [Pseudomonadota bacterium]
MRIDIVLSNAPKPRTIAAVNALRRMTTLARRVRALRSQDCHICGMKSREGLLCRGCLDDMPALPLCRCPVCAIPTPLGEVCGVCLNHPPHYDATLAAFEYRFPLEPMVVALKYRAQPHLAAFIARMMINAIERPEADCVIPMPLHPRRIIERGFNQSAEIARRLASHWRIPLMLDAAERDRDTPPQAKLSGSDRYQNVKGAFRGTRDLSGRKVAVVDDVMTTGSTLDELARTLKSRGAAHVTNILAARTLPNFGSRRNG